MDVDRPPGRAAGTGRRRAPACSGPARPGRCRWRRPAPCSCCLGLGLGVRRHRDVVERDAVRPDQRLGVGVVGHDGRDLDLQRAGAGAEQQVVEAVQVLRDHDERPVRRVAAPQLEVMPNRLADGGERRRAASRRSAGRRRAKSIRMKKRSVSRSPNCWLSTMLPPCSTRKPLTAWTMPGGPGRTGRARSRDVDSSALHHGGSSGPSAIDAVLRSTERSLRYATAAALVSRHAQQRPRSRPPAAPAGVQSVDRALSILEVLARAGEAGVTEIAAELGVHKSTAFRLVATLEAHRLVEQTGDRGRYRLGVGILRLAGATTARLDLVQEARPICRQLAADTGETVNVAVLVRQLGALPRPGRRLLGPAAPQLGRPAHPAARHQQRQGAAERARRRGARRRRSARCTTYTAQHDHRRARSCATSSTGSATRATPSRSTSSRSG